MNAYKNFASAMKTSSWRYNNRDCYCDNCCRKEQKRREGWNSTSSAKEQYNAMKGRQP
jgi:hypothetical protein